MERIHMFKFEGRPIRKDDAAIFSNVPIDRSSRGLAESTLIPVNHVDTDVAQYRQ